MSSPETAAKAQLSSSIPTKFQALKARGWIMPYDYALATTILFMLITTLFWLVFGKPPILNVVGMLLAITLIFQFWIVALVFRCSCFVIETQADINLMPEASARIVAGWFNMGGAAKK